MTRPISPRVARLRSNPLKQDKVVSARSFRLRLDERAHIMGILNVTPDSFSDGQKFFNRDAAIARAVKMADDGADIIDVGGESTRPGAEDVSIEEELRRVMPVIKGLAGRLDIPISVDTRKSEVAEAAVRMGASIINDVSGLRHDGRVAKVAARSGAVLILMHMKGVPRDMQVRPMYKDVIGEIIRFMKESIAIALRAGVKEDKIIVDPGIGFGKNVEHNLTILNRLEKFSILKRPICVGVSRKAFIGKVLGVDMPQDRIVGTIAANAIAVMKGASLLRVHDVKEAIAAAAMAESILREGLQCRSSV